MKNKTEKFELARAETQAAMIGTEGENNVPNVIRLMPVGKINGREVFAKSVVIPARPFLGVSETDKDAVKDELNTLLTEALK